MSNKKCALFIGLNNINGFPPLSGAVENAKAMYSWAKAQDFEAKLLTDEGQARVTLDDLFNAIEDFIKRSPKQLIVYFAGHGYIRDPGSEIWLLSDARRRSTEGVNLRASKEDALNFGIENVVFISDSCRTVAASIDELRVSGGSIFPNEAVPDTRTRVDVLYATRAGSSAKEVKDPNGKYSGIYTECMLDCLYGQVPQVIKELNMLTPPVMAVISYDLNEYLEERIPLLIAERRLAIKQHPFGEVNSRAPIYLSKIIYMPEGIHGIGPPVSEAQAPYDRDYDRPDRQSLEEKLLTLRKSEPETYQYINETSSFINNIISNPVPDEGHLIRLPYRGANTPEGTIRVIGLENFGVYFLQRPWRSAERYTRHSAVIRTGGDNSKCIPITVLPGFACRLIFNENKDLVLLDYYPIGTNEQRFQLYQYEAGYIAERKSLIIAAAKQGVFEGGDLAAENLRQYKALDPMLGLFAAYAYMETGNRAGVLSVYDFMAREREPVLFDVAMLRNLASHRSLEEFVFGRTPARGSTRLMPILTQGWSYLKTGFGERGFSLKEYLNPGLWTSFRPEVIDNFFRYYNYSAF
ncbi:caspase family protein [Pedobacter sp. KR3-3]|uniref:Caspase family protein n=1 Tax=Pedobacter albus TaxID=3113905 RepID=A0ABU7IAE0_9SPHI|nr:caspase family protein [Pedobacter sp. KR3-3]MEE1946433.1 caspase family protein [Pedobacter sp. KR3-3]